jgi:hypothetical protein
VLAHRRIECLSLRDSLALRAAGSGNTLVPSYTQGQEQNVSVPDLRGADEMAVAGLARNIRNHWGIEIKMNPVPHRSKILRGT